MQFIPVYNVLVKEALETAVVKKYGKVKTRVLSKEYLLALMVQTGRPKDRQRIQLFIDQAGIKFEILQNILARYNLITAWKKYKNE